MKQRSWVATFALVALIPITANAEMSAEELAKLAQNPFGNLISLPFQNNTNLNFAPDKGTQNILNIQPVIPIELNKDWNIITRTREAAADPSRLPAGQARRAGGEGRVAARQAALEGGLGEGLQVAVRRHHQALRPASLRMGKWQGSLLTTRASLV